MWNGRSIAVILPTYREKATIRDAIRGFEALGVVDDVLVINNNAEAGTSEEVAGTCAREIVEAMQGYGAAIRRGIRETSADLVCICEPDGTFEPRDLWKLLAYADDFEFVFGSRTVKELIWDGANMGHFLRWGNWAVAKQMEILFNTTSLSDVGCTMRLVSGTALRQCEQCLTDNGLILGPEIMLLGIIGGWRVIQIPVNFRPRGGLRGTTEHVWPAVRIGVAMIAMILRHRLTKDAVRQRLESFGAAQTESSEGGRPGGKPSPLFFRRLRRRAGTRSGHRAGTRPWHL